MWCVGVCVGAVRRGVVVVCRHGGGGRWQQREVGKAVCRGICISLLCAAGSLASVYGMRVMRKRGRREVGCVVRRGPKGVCRDR